MTSKTPGGDIVHQKARGFQKTVLFGRYIEQRYELPADMGFRDSTVWRSSSVSPQNWAIDTKQMSLVSQRRRYSLELDTSILWVNPKRYIDGWRTYACLYARWLQR
ncbi:hypothetical protein IG631_19437 [Alternaria alternata]|nr:hypothetical protein IG631_19437 [Alternaria alternata]